MFFNAPRTIILLYICTLYACGGTPVNVPVEELRQPPSAAKTYIVQKDDTLFAIAWRFNLDYKLLARANNISPPYLIKPNQTIFLAESSSKPLISNTLKKPTKVTVKSEKKTISQKAIKKTGKATQKSVEEGYSKTLQIVKNETWIWPVTGKITRYFSSTDNLNKGLDISAQIGTPIYSSRSGEVVYAGSKLKGYGNLIIIKHDANYLSAYAHNRKILVKEGQQVKQGDQIAELGQTGTQSPKLHFEIRRQGKPVNPLTLLEKK